LQFEFEMVFGSPSGQLAFLEVVASALSQSVDAAGSLPSGTLFLFRRG
jgi:hypothetical protein